MSRDSSPPPLSDDSAIGSLTDKSVQPPITIIPQQVSKQPPRPKFTRPSAKDQRVNSEDLEQAALQMRTYNVSLISSSIRTSLSCFEDLDVQRFEHRTEYLINFISNGINKCTSKVLRPISILWPESYDEMVERLSILDAFLINTEFKEKPIDWMLQRGLTTIPTCKQCNAKMILKSENNIVRWQCHETSACANYFMPVQRPSFFSSYEKVGLDKLLHSVYLWSTCIPGEELYSQLTMEPQILDSLWRRLQNVCRTALEKSYPRHRLTNVLDPGVGQQTRPLPIDLVSIKINDVFVVCAKHPASNLVRLGLYIPNVSTYSYVDLTESWFAHGAYIRVSESKFLGLNLRRTDLKVELVSRLEMISRNRSFHKESAFGYILCQLTHVLKDYDSSSLSRETLKLTLAEMQWRELYGTTPFDAFTNIVTHMAQYGDASDYYSEPSVPVTGEETLEKPHSSMDDGEFCWAEKYYYAAVDPVDSDGKVICRFAEQPNPDGPPNPDVRVFCHECNLPFECFDFSLHLIAHVESKRKDCESASMMKKQSIECKHCFKSFEREQLIAHSTLFRAKFQTVLFGCRICCIKLDDRATFLQHMRQMHFEHETPYRCPSCKFASFCQKDVLIHFQEEHRHSMIILCPLCLRSFTVAKPETMTREKMQELSKIVYNHLAEHYATAKTFACTNCCLCFLDNETLMKHKHLHHNPLEIRPSSREIKLTPFIVDPREERFCVLAFPMELFIANKRPNLPVEAPSALEAKKSEANNGGVSSTGLGNSSTSSGSSISSASNNPNTCEIDCSDEEENGSPTACSDSPARSDSELFFTATDDGIIYVRGFQESDKFLKGGSAAMHVPKGYQRAAKSYTDQAISSQKLIDLLSKMKRADGVIANRSVILTPTGKSTKCAECFQYITVDHFVSPITCKKCKYTTFCPRASLNHKTRHTKNAT